MKTNNFLLCVVLTFAWLLQGCNIATTVHFNKDYSGTYTTVLDLSDLIGMAGMFDTTGTMDQNKMVEEMRLSMDSLELEETYNSLSGIRDAQLDVSDEGVISIGFKFDNVEALNASFKSMQERTAQKMEGMGEGSMDMLPTDFLGGGDQLFIREGKTLTHALNTEGGLGEGLMGEGGGDDMDMMSSMIDYTIDLSFDRKVKSVDVEGLTIVEKGTHVVKTRVDFANLLKDGKYSIKVRTK
ncbi:MAG TPA: hypothetical protein VI603_08300 [Saprospiraceae bacterium]|nr:hypothetical protein [Saprospiraceae bacterium]